MRTTLFLQLVLLITTAWAGGYQGSVERLLLFYAYEIDELNDAKDRTLGFRCKKWDANKKECMPIKDPKDDKKPAAPVWEECVGEVLPSKRCTFSELTGFMGKLRGNEKLVGGTGVDKDGKKFPLPEDTKTPGIPETAINVYKTFTASNVGKVPNPPPYKFLKDAKDEFNDFISRVSDVVVKAAPTKKNAATQALFDGFKASLDQVIDARAGDHGPFLIKAVEAKGITAKRIKVGTGKNPATGETWETLDWAKTEADAEAAGKADAMADFKDEFYKPRTQGRKHKTVMETYDRVKENIKSC
ncbi:hypothetical protein GGI35DRAFT_490322 [Trichoderma velutinum]